MFDDSEDGVAFTANPLWRGHDAATRSLLSADLRGGFDLHADLDDDDSHVAYTANPLSPATRAAQVAAFSHIAEPAAAEDNWWDAPAPRVGPAVRPSGAATSGVGDRAAASEYQRRQQQQAMRIGAPEAASGFAGHSGGARLKPTVAPTLTGGTKDADDMRRVALTQRQGVAAELDALGPGRAPGYRGKDGVAADARAIVEDPRFAQTYAIDRASDSGGAAGRAVGGKIAAAKEWWGSKDRGAQAGKTAARTAARAVPFVGSGLALGGAYKEHQRAGVDDAIAADADNDALTRATATGLAGSHRKHRNKEAVAGTVGLAKDVVTVATGGLGALVPGVGGDAAASAGGSLIDRALGAGERAIARAPDKALEALGPEKMTWRAGKRGGMAVNKGLDWWDEAAEPHELRPAAIAPQARGRADLVEAGTDRANAGLMRLAAGDGAFGAKLLDHLNADLPALDSAQAVLDTARATDGRAGDHNLKPSQVARLVAGEGARQRQQARMGDTLDELTTNEARSWWEKSAGTDPVKRR